MNVRELKKLLIGLDDDMLVCGIGYFGEALEIYEGTVRKVYEDGTFRQRVIALVLTLEYSVEEPD